MDRIEEVKELVWAAINSPISGETKGYVSLVDRAVSDYAQQIDQLYRPKFNNPLEADAYNWDTRELEPKAEEGGLVDFETWWVGISAGRRGIQWASEAMKLDARFIYERIATAQRDLTSRLKDAEKEAFGLSVHEAAWLQATKEADAKWETECKRRLTEAHKAWDRAAQKAEQAITERLNAACQKRVKAIFAEAEKECPHVEGKLISPFPRRRCPLCWQALKQKEGI